jgi:hypothetical protein
MKKWMNFILNVANKCYLCGKLNRRNRVETIYVSFFQNKSTRNRVETIYVSFFQNKSTSEMFMSEFKVILHISLI